MVKRKGRNVLSVRKPRAGRIASGTVSQIHPLKPSPRIRKSAVLLAALMLGFSPMRARALDSKEPPLTPAAWADTQNVRLALRRQDGAQFFNHGYDTVKGSFNPRLFGATNSGPVFVFDYLRTRTKVEQLRFGVAQQFSFSKDAVLKLGLLTAPVNEEMLLKNTRFGLILSHGPLNLDFHYRGQVGGKSSYSGGFGYRVGKGVELGLAAGSKGYVSPTDSVRYGVRLREVEKSLGLKEGSLLRPVIDFGITQQREMPNAVDVGVVFSIAKGVNLGFDVSDIGSHTPGAQKNETKLAGFIIINF